MGFCEKRVFFVVFSWTQRGEFVVERGVFVVTIPR